MTLTPRDLILDPWSGLSHRPLLDPKKSGAGNLAPTWVGTWSSNDVRRLNAYKVLQTYIENCSRLFLSDISRQREHREYGDASLMVDAILAALLGDDLTISVDGADADEPVDPATKNTGQQNTAPGTNEDVTTTELDQLGDNDDESAANAQAEYLEDLADWKNATGRQDWLDEWIRKERFPLKINETERNAVSFGDGVYRLEWNNQKRRCVLKIEDPGFYFPVLDQDDNYDYPDRVHFAWEYPDDDPAKPDRVRRITYERVTLDAAEARGVVFSDPQPTQTGTNGALVRDYPYQDDEDSDDNEYVALITDASWSLPDLRAPSGVDSFKWDGAVFNVNGDGETLRDFDLGVDFLPVVHIPNTVAGLQHFGVASLTRIAQVLDDLAASDTDVQASSAITGAPPISFENPSLSGVETKTYGPGTAYYGGKVTIADTSRSLDALLKYVDALTTRVNVNGRVPAEVLGRVDASKISSGVQLALSFGPFRSLVNAMRLVRDDKYALLFKFVQRISIIAGEHGVKAMPAGALDKGAEVLDVAVTFGSYLPNDLKGTVDIITSMLREHAISRSTALRMLQDAGLDIRDLKNELEAIEGEDFLGALKLAEAVADETAARQYLHLPEKAPAELIPPATRGGPVVPNQPNSPFPVPGVAALTGTDPNQPATQPPARPGAAPVAPAPIARPQVPARVPPSAVPPRPPAPPKR